MGSRAAVVHPSIGTESRLKGKRAHILAPVRAVEQITAQTVIGLLEVLLDDGGCAVRVRAAGVGAVPPAEHPLRSGQERGALLDRPLARMMRSSTALKPLIQRSPSPHPPSSPTHPAVAAYGTPPAVIPRQIFWI